MIVRTTLTHAALTRSGTGRESFKLKPTRFIGVWMLQILNDPNYSGTHDAIEITLDNHTAIALRQLLQSADL